MRKSVPGEKVQGKAKSSTKTGSNHRRKKTSSIVHVYAKAGDRGKETGDGKKK